MEKREINESCYAKDELKNRDKIDHGDQKCQLMRLGMTTGLIGENKSEEASGFVGDFEMGNWLEEVWFKHVPQPNFLLADSFPVHTSQSTQKLLLKVGLICKTSSIIFFYLKRDSCLAIIPNACSAKLQPLHQGIKEKFKVMNTYIHFNFLSAFI